MCREAAFRPQWMCDPVSLLCFVIRYCQLRVTENPDSTSSNNKECIMSPNKKPGAMVVLGWFTQQGSVSTGQPGAPYLSVLLAQCADQRRAAGFTALRPPT